MAGKYYRKKKSRGWGIAAAVLCCAAVCAALWFTFGDAMPGVVQTGAPAGEASSAVSPVESEAPPSSAEPEPVSEPESEPEPQPVVTTARVSASGDNLIHDGIYIQAQKRAAAAGEEGYDFSYLYENAVPIYEAYDLNLINVETLVSDELEPSSYPRFCSPGDVARELYRIGFRGFFLANNHTYDKGAEGIASTLRFWESMPEDCVTSGLYRDREADNASYTEVNGITFAFLAYTEMTNGLATPSGAEASVIYTSEEDVLAAQIAYAAERADVVAVSVHWGVENTHNVSDSQRALAQKLADWGADIIIGTHPHVVQPIETVTSADGRAVPVAYSLGNYVSAQDRLDNLVGIVLGFEATKTVQPDGSSDTAIGSVTATPVVMHYDKWFANMRLYPLSAYTDELAAAHGIGNMSIPYVREMLAENLAPEYWE